MTTRKFSTTTRVQSAKLVAGTKSAVKKLAASADTAETRRVLASTLGSTRMAIAKLRATVSAMAMVPESMRVTVVMIV